MPVDMPVDMPIADAAARMPSVAAPLLAWYDRHARRLPWRTADPDPYRVWLSEIMLQQTTVAAATPYFHAFVARWPTLEALAAADDAAVMAAWAGLGYYARARNMLACARALAQAGGRFPADEAMLRALPGIGRYTAAAIAAIAFGRRAVVVDGNVERVVARLAALETPLPAARAAIDMLAELATPDARPGDFAQAMMDLGATVCTPRRPACALCPLGDLCAARATGAPETYPRKAAKAARPERHGIAWWLEADGRVALVRRPATGLLAGMAALPTGAWTDERTDGPPPVAAGWATAGAIRHVFTHFALTLELRCAAVAELAILPGAMPWPIADIAGAGLPTAFARLVPLAAAWRAGSASCELDEDQPAAVVG